MSYLFYPLSYHRYVNCNLHIPSLSPCLHPTDIHRIHLIHFIHICTVFILSLYYPLMNLMYLYNTYSIQNILIKFPKLLDFFKKLCYNSYEGGGYMGNTEKIIDTCLLTTGSIYSLANIEHILGIIILIIQLLWIMIKLVVKIVNTIKKKESLNLLDDDFSSAIGSLSDIMTSLNSDDKEVDNEQDIEQK